MDEGRTPTNIFQTPSSLFEYVTKLMFIDKTDLLLQIQISLHFTTPIELTNGKLST